MQKNSTTLDLPSVPSEENSTEKKKKKTNWFGWMSGEDTSSCVVKNLHVPVASQEDYLPKDLKLLCRDCESIRLVWDIKNMTEEETSSENYEVEIRYKPSTSVLSNSKKLSVRLKNTTKGDVIIDSLKCGTKYKVDARVRRILNDAVVSSSSPVPAETEKWSKYSDSLVAETRNLNIQEQIDLARRTADWLAGNLKPYPLVHKSDTALAKAERIATGALNVAAWTGLGGMYVLFPLRRNSSTLQ